MPNIIDSTYLDGLDLTTTQREAVNFILETGGATAEQIADELDYKTTSGAYDIVGRARQRGAPIVCTDGTYRLVDPADVDDSVPGMVAVPDGTGAVPASRPRRLKTKQAITREANEFLADLEDALHAVTPVDTPVAELTAEPGNQDLVMFRTDDHFGEVSNRLLPDNEVVETFNSQIAAERVNYHYARSLAEKDARERMGVDFDTFHLVMNGDHVTNEVIFHNQPWGVDRTIRGQLADAHDAYFGIIKDAAGRFPSVQVICQAGNHGEFRVKGASSEANADDLLFDSLERTIDAAGLRNVNFIKNIWSPETMFWLRKPHGMKTGKWMGYMRHGQDTLGHIGTNSAKQRWGAWLQDTADMDPRPFGGGFNVAFTGHYHELKFEQIAGRPVLMGGSLSPTGDYENTLGIPSGRPGAWTLGVSDDEPVAWQTPVYFQTD
jgi:hypothetical protein